MTFQQLEYIVAVDAYGHFSEAAYSLGITQPTLSATISKLESEFDVTIFDRSKHPIEPTPIGRRIIDQAKLALVDINHISEIAHNEKDSVKGNVNLGIIPTVAPYIVPAFFTILKNNFPELSVTISEMPTAQQIPALKHGDLDLSILATDENDTDLLEIPIYKEELIAYMSDGHRYSKFETISTEMLKGDDLWVLKSEHCLSAQVLSICHLKKDFKACYSAGNIFTLIDIVDSQGGYTIIPEFHYNMLSPEQKKRVRHFATPEPIRTVSLYIRKDFIREGVLNAVIKCIYSQLPLDKINASIMSGPVKI